MLAARALPLVRSAAPCARALAAPRTFPQYLVRSLPTYYTKEHEWVRVDDNSDIGTVGISAHAAGTLGDIVYVELPEVGQEFKVNDTFGIVESVKSANDMYTPLDGTVTAINDALEADPPLVNKSPEGDGWFIKMKLANPDDLKSLMDAAAYKKFCESE